MQRCLICCSRGALILLLTVGAAWAQGTAQLSGTVRDESGAVLPGVTVTVTQTDTGLVRTTVTDDTGGYVMTNLPTGPYRLEVALQGFRTYVQTGIVLQVGGTPTVNAALAVGSLEESVTVEAAAPLVDVRSAGISTVVDNEAILELPLQGRQVTDLIVLAGAAVQTGTSSTRSMSGGVLISVGGGLPFGVAYTLDGAAHNDPQGNTNLPLPFPDALQEFQVATSGLSAESGVKSGASVNAVTKAGTNRFSGSGFEFLRDRRFNAPQHFAAFGPDGKQVDDGLRRNQFGGTLGGPIVRDKLFFFGAYQGTILRQVPTGNISYVPTAQMLAGDFTTITSPQCAGRQINLGAPFVGNRISPALFSPAALNLVAKLPQTTNPCGEIKWEQAGNEDQHMPVARVDFQVTNNQLIFGRYLGTKISTPPSWSGPGDNILKTTLSGALNQLHSVVLGHTQVVSASVVNAVRATYNHTTVQRFQPDGFFSPADVGVKMFSYPPANQFSIAVTNNFELMSGTATQRKTFNKLAGVSDDVTVVRGRHQLGFGADVRRWQLDSVGTSRTGGTWTVDGSATGHSLADLLTGRVARLEIGGPNILNIHNWYLGAYAQDAWRLSDRVTLNGGVRWEPYFGQSVDNNAIVIFRKENFDQGIRSQVFLNAPPGLIYPGDEGFPEGKTGLDIQWWNLAPRVGVAWDVRGDGRLAIRSSYSMGYDFMAGEYHNINAGAPPFGNRSLINDPPGRMDDPWGHLGGDPHPIVLSPNVAYIPFGAFGSMDPGINSPRVQQWNVMVEQQLGDSWGVSATYLGSNADRLWAQTAINPGVFLGLGPCTLNTATGPRTFPVCSTNANLNERRKLSLENPVRASQIGALDLNSDVGWQKYKGLKLAARHRTATGVSLNASYTLSQCKGTPTATAFNQTSAGYTNPDDPDLDAGFCDQDRTHLGTLNMGYQTPDVGAGIVHALASGWRLSGILSARSGGRLNITSGVDRAFNGISAQRPDSVPGVDDIYGPGRNASGLEPGQQIDNYFNREAFVLPAAGAVGNLTRNIAVGPAFWQIDLAVSKLISIAGMQRLELRLESFNLLNTFNWGNPAINLNAATFGRITTQSGDPRILQFGVKYDFSATVAKAMVARRSFSEGGNWVRRSVVMTTSKTNHPDRREFLKGAAVGAVALAATPQSAAAAEAEAQAPAVAVPSAQALAAETQPVSADVQALIEDHPGSDFMVDVLKHLGFEYIAANPGSSFRSLHESIINYGGNKAPELLTCCHEESSVFMACGYAKAEGKPMAIMAHSTVGLQHASIGIYEAFGGQIPVFIILGNTIDATTRRPGVEWSHSAQDAAAMVRDYTKWDDLPISLTHFAESAVRAYKIAMTPPMGPVVLVADSHLQETGMAGHGGPPRMPKLTLARPPAADAGAVAELAALLVAAENPVILGNAARTPEGMRMLIELAETLQAPVSGGSFPSRHPLRGGGGLIRNADLIVGLDVNDLWGTVNTYLDQQTRSSQLLTKQGAKLVSITSSDLYLKSNYQNFQRYTEVDMAIAADPEATLPSLIEAVKKLVTPERRRIFEERGTRLAAASAQALQQARTAATFGWDASPVSIPRLSAELWNAIKDHDWVNVGGVGGGALWNVEKHYQVIDGGGVAAEGGDLPTAVGAALAHRKHGRLAVSIQKDGDFMYAPGALWTAAHHRIPLLSVMYNNRAYHQEVMHIQRMANRHQRGITNAGIGNSLSDPNIDFGAMARAMGVHGEGPITNPNDLGPAIKRAVDVVLRGEPALVDVVTQPR